MAIQFVGGTGAGRAGSTSTVSQSLTSLTGGIASAPAEGDLVIVVVATASQARNPTCAISGWDTIGTQLNVTSQTYDVSLQVSYKFMGSTPDTSVTIPSTGNVDDGQSRRVLVFRGVDPTTPFDVSSVSATGTGTTRFDAAAITPTTAGAWIVVMGGGAASASTTALGTPSGLSGWAAYNGADTNDGSAGGGYYDGWTSGSYNPAAPTTGGSVNAANSWAAWTMALRPKVTVDDVDLAPTSATVAPGGYVELTATATLSGSPASGEPVTAVSSDAAKATVFVADKQSSSGDMTWRNNAVPSPTYSAPGGTSPLGATIRRFTEAAATTYHQGGWSSIDQTNMAAGDKIVLALEVKVTNATAVAIASYSNTDGTQGYVAALNPSTGATATLGTNGTVNSSTTLDLGGGWWLWLFEYTYAAGSDGSILPSIGLSNTTTATMPSYAGNTSNYMDVGVCTIYVQRASPSTTTTDGSGNQVVLVRGVAAGTANITATAGGVDSNTSAITVSSAQTLTATRYTDGDTFGSATLVQGGGGAQTLTATRYSDGDTFGAASLRARTTLAGTRYVDADAYGNAALRAIARLTASRYADGDTFGNATLVQAAATQTLVATRYADADTFGNASLRGRATLATTRYANTQTFGNAALRARYTLAATRLEDGDAFGNAVLRARTTLAATRYTDGDAFGAAVIRTRTTLAATAYANAPTFGAAILNVGDGKQYLSATRYASANAYGNATIVVAARILTPTLYADGDEFGAATLVQAAAPQTLSPTLFVNAPSLGGVAPLPPIGLIDGGQFGNHTLVGGDAGTTPEAAPEKQRGAGGMPRRRYIRVWNGEEWVEVHSVEAAQQVIEAAEAKAAQAAQEAAQRLAERPKVRMRAARRAAPVVRVDAPQEDVAAIQRRVEETNAKLRAMYENALRAEMIGRLIRQRLEEDEEDAILALLD